MRNFLTALILPCVLFQPKRRKNRQIENKPPKQTLF